MKKILLGLIAVTSLAASNAAVLVNWDTTGFLGTETSIASSGVATGLTASAITLGSALGTTAGGGGMNTNGWTTALNATSGNYYTFTLTVQSGYELTLSSFNLVARSSGTGPRDFGVYYSGNSFASTIGTFSTSGTSYVAENVSLSSLTLVAGTYEFRIGLTSTTSSNGTGTVATGGTSRIMNVGSTSATAGPTPINFNGTLASVPEPSTVAMLFAGAGSLFWVVRLRRAFHS